MLAASVDGGIDLGLALWGVGFLPVGIGVVGGAVASRRQPRVLVVLSMAPPAAVLGLVVWNAVNGRSTWIAFAGWGVAAILYVTSMWRVAAPWREPDAGWNAARQLVRGMSGSLSGAVVGAIAVMALAGYLVHTVTWSLIGIGALVGAAAGLGVSLRPRVQQADSTL